MNRLTALITRILYVRYKPYWVHDSTCCTYLESRKCDDGPYDAYYCTQGGISPTLLLRFGSEGSEYLSSQLDFAMTPESQLKLDRLKPKDLKIWRTRRAWILDMKKRYGLQNRSQMRALRAVARSRRV